MSDADRTLDQLDAMSEQWAERVKLRSMAKAVANDPNSVEALCVLAFAEGAYHEFTSHTKEISRLRAGIQRIIDGDVSRQVGQHCVAEALKRLLEDNSNG